MRLKLRTLAMVGMFALIPAADRVHGQTPTPEFDVATVKVNKDASGGFSLVRTPGGLTATGAEFGRLIEMAFQTRSLDLSAVPDSVRMERFDIAAKATARILGEQYWDMLRLLLEQRFDLKHHIRKKSVDLYRLVSAKEGTSLGPEIRRSPDPDCPLDPTRGNFCGVSAQPGYMVGQRVTMARIARELSAFTGRPVLDQTGFRGSFDFRLIWTPDANIATDGRPKMLNGAALDPYGPSFYSAVREQLGMKFQPKRSQIEILVIDHAEQPREN